MSTSIDIVLSMAERSSRDPTPKGLDRGRHKGVSYRAPPKPPFRYSDASGRSRDEASLGPGAHHRPMSFASLLTGDIWPAV